MMSFRRGVRKDKNPRYFSGEKNVFGWDIDGKRIRERGSSYRRLFFVMMEIRVEPILSIIL